MKNTKTTFLFMFLLIGFVAIGAVLINRYNPARKELEAINDDDNIQLNTEMSLKSKIRSVISERGFSYVELYDSQHIVIRHSRNYNYSEPWINKFLKPGDSLTKAAGSDTLWILRDSEEYYFVVGKFINGPK